MGTGGRLAGMVAGLLICVTFGLVFVEVNSGGLPGAWTLVFRIAGAVVAVALYAGIARVARLPVVDVGAAQRGFSDRRYLAVVAGEAIVLFGGLLVINGALGMGNLGIAWVAVVVGVHFVVLGRVWRMPAFQVLGIVQTALGVAGFVVGGLGASAATVGVVAGVGSGLALYVMAVITIAGALRRRAPERA